MKKRVTLLAMVFALASLVGMALPAAAADLHHAHDDGVYACKYGGNWHFVNNQTKGATDAELWIDWGYGWIRADDDADKVNKKVLHFWVKSYGNAKLMDAVTVVPDEVEKGEDPRVTGRQIPGKLVLSDYSCNCSCVCGG